MVDGHWDRCERVNIAGVKKEACKSASSSLFARILWSAVGPTTSSRPGTKLQLSILVLAAVGYICLFWPLSHSLC